MGNSTRRQRSLSATRRRAERRRQSSPADGIEEETTTTTIYGLSSIFIWILATSSLVVVITPQTSNHIRSTSHDPGSVIEKFIRDRPTSLFKMNAQYNNHMDDGNEEQANKAMFMPFRRQQGLRFRDDARMMEYFNNQNYGYPIRPILTEQQQYPFSMGASTSNHHASTSDFNEIGLMDLDLIDILWRSDIAVEKGTQQVEPSDQYESDLQTLTEKSTVQVRIAITEITGRRKI
uniref:Prion-like-(Q/N-rich) domain-bearing protein 25 n=1 Tax=Caenorhabditis tropicalis TaxID=1561998 RepID=A0A1I7T5A3_9PELO